jgi:ribosomal protein L11 methyltransferase
MPESESVYSEILKAELYEIGYEGFWEEENTIKAYITIDKFDFEKVRSLDINTNQGFKIRYCVKPLQNKNWNEEWEKNYFKPIVIGKQCLIRGSFHTDVPETKYQIIIDPKMSFGTGHHETTSLMLEYILELPVQNKLVLDMGCGTGVLGILSSMLGAMEVIGIDNDEWAFKNSCENLSLNRISNMNLILGDVSTLLGQKFDIILANINRNVLIKDIPAYVELLNKDGILVISGFYTEDIPSLQEIAENSNLKFMDMREKNNWTAVRFFKGN